MTCCSTCISGFAAVVALLAFIFDLAFFFLAKARINEVGSAEIGNAIWLTLAAWVLLFFSGCFYTLGRCCISKRKARGKGDNKDDEAAPVGGGYDDRRRLDAVKAEADRKTIQKATEGGLPAFHETQPLTARVEGDAVYVDNPYHDQYNSAPPSATPGYDGRPHGGGYAGGGYAQAPQGTRAVDEYYSPTNYNNVGSTYPPQPQNQRQATGQAAGTSTYAPSTYAASTYTYSAPNAPSSPPPNNQYLSANTQQYPDRYGSPGHEYGHTLGGTTCTSFLLLDINPKFDVRSPDHSAISHPQNPSTYSQYDPYGSQQPDPAFNSDAYNNTALLANVPQHDRSYTLGGDGYGSNALPPLPDHNRSSVGYLPYPGETHHSPGPINTDIRAVSPPQTSPVRGPREQRMMSPIHYDDNPPGYDAGSAPVPSAWSKS